MTEPNRRRTYLINPRFQWRFIGFMAAVSLLAILMLFVSNILFFREMRQEALAAGLTIDNPYFDPEASLEFTSCYLSMRTRTALQRWRGEPYQRAGATARGWHRDGADHGRIA